MPKRGWIPPHVRNRARAPWWRRIFPLRRRSARGDRIHESTGYAMAEGVRFVLASGHRDAPLSRRGRIVWWSVLAIIIVGGAVLIALVR